MARFMVLISVLGLANLSLTASLTSPRSLQPLVALDYAAYQGIAANNGITHFYGMRYAAAPVGQLRWRPPQDPPAIAGTQSAAEFKAVCVGVGQTTGTSPLGGVTLDEDCLYISVTTPSNATSTSKLPVLFYFSGGGFAQLNSINYNFDDFVVQSQQSVVVVQFNYRVGALGFLAGDEVKAGGSLNAGLLDQRKALRWVQKYISKFGGDPQHVVLFGGSAGAGSVGLHLSAYGGRDDGLFVGAIGDAYFYPTVNHATYQEIQFRNFSSTLGCDTSLDQLACLRNVDISKLQTANIPLTYPGEFLAAEYIWTPVVDGVFVQGNPLGLYQQSKFVKVPLISGDVTDEGTLFTPKTISSAAGVTSFVAANYPDLSSSDLAQVNTLYLPPSSSYYHAAAAAYGDATFTCPGNLIATYASQVAPVWRYQFNQSSAVTRAFDYGVPHNIDLGAIFGPNVGPYTGLFDLIDTVTNALSFGSFANENAAVSAIMMNYIISFTKTLDPNPLKASQAPTWTQFAAGGHFQQIVVQNQGSSVQAVTSTTSTRCSFWASVLAETRQ
ncbi:hypothetical protein M409DRAFT_54332 [Zasmidium cellare ATCC 36951]|uniref:Carboxylic ester hydrolase n=1 Tax=Zasmidium cellare ATCC 36951 TaxID=1080233 RepID=A0A6A6CKJ5_ZASCE|nr:uncharacterized protein M409DRAFT_54332 [Zasmidium cellare ATCC 36951]KAF2167133.1 hypothetical protein M409DRAFT_54332 [Zasmidium cellare ATCC 36951]